MERSLALRGLLLSDSPNPPLHLGPEDLVGKDRPLAREPENGTSHPGGAFRPENCNYWQAMKSSSQGG